MTAEAVFADGIVADEQPAAGERVLWLHGYTMDATVWHELWQLLPKQHHIAVDLPGHGRSRAVGPKDDLRVLGRVFADAAAAAGVRHVVGLSFGTTLALQLALERPKAFKTLTLAAPALAGGPQDAAAGARYVELINARRAGATGPQLAELWMRSPPDIFRGAQSRPELHARLERVIAEHSWAELEDSSMLRLTQPAQPQELLHRIEAATTVIIGDAELPPFRRTAELICEAVPRAAAHELADAGHLCLLEQPRTAAALLERVFSTVE